MRQGGTVQSQRGKTLERQFVGVTMSVTVRSRSATPDKIAPIDPLEIDEIRY
jgi:hypothetical protein